MRTPLFVLLSALVLAAACGQKQPAEEQADASLFRHEPGDSALYGLACEGCTDSVLVVLPYSDGDPDTFDIIDAYQQRRIYGRPHIGDELAVIVNPEDSGEALMVIDIDGLKGTWCYLVRPTLRHIDSMPERMRRRMMAAMPDSVRELLTAPHEYSLRLKRDNTAMAQGAGRQWTAGDDMSPVEFPPVRHYTEWRLYNGRIILKADTIGGLTADGEVPVSDTADIVLMMRDSLVLRFASGEQAYYRQRDDRH